MCLNCTDKTAAKRQLPPGRGFDQALDHGNRSSYSISRRAAFCSVSATRVRCVLERTVMTGLGPLIFPHLPPGSRQLPKSQNTRGGARQAFARQVAIYLGHVGCGLSYTQVGRIYGRDRTTAAHACAVVEDRREDPALDRVLVLLELCVQAEFTRIEPRYSGQID